MLGPEDLLDDGQRAAVQRFSRRVVTFGLQEKGQIVRGLGRQRVLTAESAAIDLERLSVQGLGPFVVSEVTEPPSSSWTSQLPSAGRFRTAWVCAP